MLHDFQARHSVCVKELQSLIGLLNFMCQVVVPGHMIDLTIGVKKPHHHIHLLSGAKSDLMLWLRFLEDFNGRSFFFGDVWETSQALQLYTDSAGSIGFGAIFGRHWFYGSWPGHWKTYNIALLGLFPIVIAVHIWGSLMSNKRVMFFSDNASVVDVINNQTSKHRGIRVLSRDLVLSCLRNNIMF